MAAADHGGPGPDHYQLLGVARGASREEIAQAWRRRARAEHPDRRPGEAGDEAAGLFRALAEAYRVLSDPGRRAAPAMPAAVPVAVRVARPGSGTGPPPVPGPPLRVGPVRVQGPSGVPARGRDRDEDEIRLAALAALALHRLARDRHWPWRDRDWPW